MDTANGKRVCKKATKKFAHATTTKENKLFAVEYYFVKT